MGNKIEKEQKVVSLMIELYCRGHRHEDKHLCPQCQALEEYAAQRISKCPWKETKTFCSSCSTHCYKPEMREKIKQVMRYSGPRMLLHHPVLAIRHLIDTKKQKGNEVKA